MSPVNITPAQLRAQYERARQLWPFLHDVEVAYGLPRFLLFAVGSRETNLRPEFTEGATGDGGHGHGLFQLDDRWHNIPKGFDTDARLQAVTAATKLDLDFDRWGQWVPTLNYYNSGSPNTWDTTGEDYGPDVWGRRTWLAENMGGGGEERHAMKLVSRDDAALREARGRTALNVKVATAHWGGDSPGPIDDHDECAGWLRAWQAQHMDTAQLAPQGATDIAYNLGVCQHGYVFELRGRGTRSAANGSYDANSSSYAIVYVGGTGAPFTDEAKHGFNDAAEYLGASLDWGHRDWVGTGCPGDEIYQWVHDGHPRPDGPAPARPSVPIVLFLEEDDMPTPFHRDPQDMAGNPSRPVYRHEWVPMNAQPVGDGREYRVNVHIMQLTPRKGRHCRVTILGQGFGRIDEVVHEGDTLEVQPAGYGAVAIISEDGDELVCSWDRVVELIPA